jgi:pyridoxamine 5'-phosphate oxidase
MTVLDFDAMHQLAWQHWEQALQSAKHPFRQLVLATLHQGLPDVRTVVLRKADAAAGMLYFHTDSRSPKVAAMREMPQVALLFYHHDAKLQLRIQAEATILTDGPLVDAQWAASSPSSKRCYLTAEAPSKYSAVHTIGFDPVFGQRLPSHAEAEPGRAYFALVACHIKELDFLLLGHDGHQRALLQYQNGHLTAGHWLVP